MKSDECGRGLLSFRESQSTVALPAVDGDESGLTFPTASFLLDEKVGDSSPVVAEIHFDY